ncbi:MAG: hypothetical protein ABH828_02880 [archaeon]
MVTKNKSNKKEKIQLTYTTINYSEQGFLTMIEKRVRRDIRINKKVKGNIIEILNDKSKEFFMTKLLLENIFGKRLKIMEVKKSSKKTIVPTNLDREIKKKLEKYLKNKKTKKENIKILNNVLEEEIIIFCKLHRIKIVNKEEKNGFIESIEKTQPGTKFAMAKSFEKIFP